MDVTRETRLKSKWRSLNRSNARKSVVQLGFSMDDGRGEGTLGNHDGSRNVNMDGSPTENAGMTPMGKFREGKPPFVIDDVKTNQHSTKDVLNPANGPPPMRRMSSIAGMTMETEPKETSDEKPKSRRRASMSQPSSS